MNNQPTNHTHLFDQISQLIEQARQQVQRHMRHFYQTLPIRETVSLELSWSH